LKHFEALEFGLEQAALQMCWPNMPMFSPNRAIKVLAKETEAAKSACLVHSFNELLTLT
jgi:hypothetical protein